MWDKLDGYKTFITAGIGFVTAGLAVFGLLSEDLAKEIGILLIPIALVFLRMGIKKAEPTE